MKMIAEKCRRAMCMVMLITAAVSIGQVSEGYAESNERTGLDGVGDSVVLELGTIRYSSSGTLLSGEKNIVQELGVALTLYSKVNRIVLKYSKTIEGRGTYDFILEYNRITQTLIEQNISTMVNIEYNNMDINVISKLRENGATSFDESSRSIDELWYLQICIVLAVIVISIYGVLKQKRSVRRYISSMRTSISEGRSEEGMACEKCGSKIDVGWHLFYYGKQSVDVEYPKKTTTTTFSRQWFHSASVCKLCSIKKGQSGARIVISALLFGSMTLVGFHMLQGVDISTFAIVFYLIVLVVTILWMWSLISDDPTTDWNVEASGVKIAISIWRRHYKKQGYTEFWSPNEYKIMVEEKNKIQ